MLIPFAMMTLLLDAARVIEIRLQMMALGQNTPNEMVLMVSEKIAAIGAANAIVLSGGSPARVIDHYQAIVSANFARLTSVV